MKNNLRIITILAAFGVILSSAATNFSQTAESPKRSDDLVAQAILEIDKSDEETANKHLQEALKLNPKNAAAYYQMGQLYFAGSDHQKIIFYDTKALAIRPDYADAYFSRADSYSQLKKWNEALSDVNNALKFGYNAAYGYGMRGWINGNLNRPQDEIADYRKALEMDPHFEAAKKQLEIALAKQSPTPSKPPQYFDFSKISEKTKKELESAAASQSTVAKKPTPATDRSEEDILRFLQQVNACLDRKDYVCVVQTANDGLEKYPGNPRLLNSRGVGFAAQSRTNEAIADFTTAIKADPRFFNAYRNRGRAYFTLIMNDKAIADYNEAININPNFTKALSERGDFMIYQGQYEIAEADLKKVAELDPQDKDAAINLNLVKILKNAGFNTDKTRDTLIKYQEYVTRIDIAMNFFNENMKEINSVVAEIPRNPQKVCNAISYLKPLDETIANYGTKLSQLVSDKQLDKVPEIKNNALGVVNNAVTFHLGYTEALRQYSCK